MYVGQLYCPHEQNSSINPKITIIEIIFFIKINSKKMKKDYIVITPEGDQITVEQYLETEDYHKRLEKSVQGFLTNEKQKQLIKLFKKTN